MRPNMPNMAKYAFLAHNWAIYGQVGCPWKYLAKFGSEALTLCRFASFQWSSQSYLSGSTAWLELMMLLLGLLTLIFFLPSTSRLISTRSWWWWWWCGSSWCCGLPLELGTPGWSLRVWKVAFRAITRKFTFSLILILIAQELVEQLLLRLDLAVSGIIINFSRDCEFAVTQLRHLFALPSGNLCLLSLDPRWDLKILCSPSPLTGGFQMLPKSFTNTTICWSIEIRMWRSGWEGLRWWLTYVQQTWETSWWGQNYHQWTGDKGPDVGFNLASKSAARQGVSVVSTPPTQVHTPAPWPTRPGQ